MFYSKDKHKTRHKLLKISSGSEKAWFEYASDGEPLYMVYNGTRFIYLKNAQGDIIGMRNESTKKIVFYTYNEWGVLYHINYEDGTPAGGDPAAKFNPLRYRGYVYDNETELYYLNSRYYDPQTTRFLNADTTNTLGLLQALYYNNLFTYCDNNPITRADDDGDFWHILIGGVIGAAVGGIVSAVSQQITEGEIDWEKTLVDAGAGALSGALAATGVGVGASIALNAAIGMSANATKQVIDNNGINNLAMTFDVESMLLDGAIGGVAGAVGGKGYGSNYLKSTSNQLSKRVVNTVVYKTTASIVARETKKAVVNYAKNSASTIARGVVSGIMKPNAFAFATSVVRAIVSTKIWGLMK